jgi:hypothetical protein
MNLGPVDALIRRFLAHEGSLVGRAGRASFDNFVATCNEVLFRYDYIRKSAVHHSPNLLEAFQAGRYWHSEVVREILMEKMGNSADIVVILENSREFPDDLFVQFFLHDRSFPEWKLPCENK